jgi:hypothetical protein
MSPLFSEAESRFGIALPGGIIADIEGNLRRLATMGSSDGHDVLEQRQGETTSSVGRTCRDMLDDPRVIVRVHPARLDIRAALPHGCSIAAGETCGGDGLFQGQFRRGEGINGPVAS